MFAMMHKRAFGRHTPIIVCGIYYIRTQTHLHTQHNWEKINY